MRLRAPDPATLFACAGRSLFALMGARVDESAEAWEQTIEIDSIDVESLLVDWLSELLFLFETTGGVVEAVCMESWIPTALRASVRCRRLVGSTRFHVKAVTYHGLSVRQDGSGPDAPWCAEVTLDI